LQVERDGSVHDLRTGLVMTGPFRRKLILGLCTLFAGPYPIARDDGVRALSNADLGGFLAQIFSRSAQPTDAEPGSPNSPACCRVDARHTRS
jgi:hypothetical protein